MLYVILTGPPGSGKGTQGLRLCEKYALRHLSTGDLFRKHMRDRTDLGEQIRQIVENGRLVPDKIVHEGVVHALKGLQGVKGVLLDGYPRTLMQAQALDAYLGPAAKKLFVLHLDVPAAEIKQRIRLRGKHSGRSDDQDESKVNHRLQVYEAETLPVLAYYRKQQKLHSIPALGKIETIFAALSQQVDELLHT